MLSQKRDYLQNFYNGDKTVWEQIYNENYVSLVGYALSITKVKEDAEDIAIGAFEGLFKNRRNIKEKEYIRPYLFVVARRRSLDHIAQSNNEKDNLKKLHSQQELQQAPAAYQDDIIHLLIILKPLLDLMPKQTRDILLLHIEGLPDEEIAKRLDTTVKNVYSKKYLGKNQLKVLFERHKSNLDLDSLVIAYLFIFSDILGSN